MNVSREKKVEKNDCSEFGTIGISARLGGIRRAW